MSTRSGNIKGFYKQKKTTTTKTGITGIKKSPSSAATLGSDITQPPALLSNSSPDLPDEYEKEEEVLRQFDMNMAYGPCLGMSRLARWERASVLGLNPPQQVHHLLLKAPTARSHCLWEGRI